MASSPDDFHLWIAEDKQSLMVAIAPIKMNGSARTREWGSVTEHTSAPLSADQATRRTQVRLVVLWLAGLIPCWLGVWLNSGFAAGAVLVVLLIASVVLIAASGAATKPGSISAPNLARFPELHEVLSRREERSTFRGFVDLAERVGRTLPALDGLVDPSEAGELLAEALWDAAELLGQKQELRRVREELEQFRSAGPGVMTRARFDLASQEQQADRLWTEADEQLNRLTQRLTAAAEAGEAFIRDRDLDATLRRTEEALGNLSSFGDAGVSESGERLAEETVEVVAAYRDLNDLYGGKR